jgi:hypothetical protein
MEARFTSTAIVRASALAALVLTVAACSDSERSAATAWTAEYDTIADTVVVRTVAGSTWGDTAELIADLTIGEFEGRDEYMFGRVGSLAVAPDGSIYVFDRHAMELRKYAPDGTYVKTFGREGGGPGEYKRPDGGLAVLPDGRVLLRDPGNTRISVYSPDGEYIDSWRIRGSFNTSRPLYVDTAGNSYTLILLDAQANVTDWTFGLVRYGPDGAPSDTIPAPRYDYEPPELVASYSEGDNTSTSVSNVPFTPSVVWTYSPLGYMVSGVSTRYGIDLYLAPDRVLRIERADWNPVPVLDDERAERERIMTANMRQTEPGWRWHGDPIPSTKPPWADIFVGVRGRIWVLLHQEAYQIESDEEPEERPGEIPTQTWVEPVAFDVFAPDGRYLGMVRAPKGFSWRPQPVFRGDTVWATVRDELEVPYVVRFHVQHSSGAT